MRLPPGDRAPHELLERMMKLRLSQLAGRPIQVGSPSQIDPKSRKALDPQPLLGVGNPADATAEIGGRADSQAADGLLRQGQASAPVVSVVVPARNEAQGISRCIASVRRALDWAGLTSVEIVVIDDDSDDDTLALAQASGATVVCQRPRRGPMAAWLRGVEVTTAPYIIFVDGDCEVSAGAFVPLLAAFARPEVGVVGGRSHPSTAEARVGVVERSANFSAVILDQIKRRIPNHDFVPIGRLMAVRRDAWEVTDGSLEPNDRVVGMLAKSAGWEVTYAPEAVVLYDLVTTYRLLREDYFRTHVRKRSGPLSFDRLPGGIVSRAVLTGAIISPRDAIAWATCRVLLLVEEAVRIGRRAPHIW